LLGRNYDLSPAAQAPNSPVHHYVRRYEADVRRGQAVVRLLAQMREQGFDPNAICVHPDWGGALFIHLVWPDAAILCYAECFREHASLLYDGINTRAFCPDPEAALVLLPDDAAPADRRAGDECVSGCVPDTVPLPAWFPARLARSDTVVTFIDRTLEPCLGWPSFAQVIPLIQARCPQAHFVIVGRTSGGYWRGMI
jgi:glycosyltransferase involved in cell wall biosynthesis